MTAGESSYHTVSSFECAEQPNSSSHGARMQPIKKYRQMLAGVVVNLSSVALGTTLGWTSPIFPKFHETDSPLDDETSKDEESWIGSLVALGALIAPFAAGPLADRFGRKWTLLGSTVFFVLSWILLITTNNVPQIYVARLLQGFGVGFVMTVQTMYIGEIASDECRGALGSFMQLFIVTGILYVYAIGPYVSYVTLQIACLIIPIIFAVAFFFMPESPHFYIGKGKKREAIASLRFLRGQSEADVKDEMELIQTSVEEAMKNKGTIRDILNSKGNMKALLICAGLICFQQLSGINVILFFSQSIFIETGSDLEPAVATILVGIVQVVASGATPLIADRLGRRIILLCSAAGMCLFLTTMGLFFYLKHIESEALSSLGWLPVVSLIGFVIVYCVGFGPLPWAVLGEMFPANIKSIASSIVASTCWILGFAVTKWFQTLADALGTHWCFWLFAIFCAAAFLFTLTVVMETKGLSLKQIQDKLNNRR